MAALLVFPLVTILAGGMGLLGGMLIAVSDRSVDPYLYWNTIAYWVVLKDFLTGIGKSVVFGALVTLIGCYNGLATEGGTEGLGRSTTATVVQVAMGVIISDFFITKLFLLMFCRETWPPMVRSSSCGTCGSRSTASTSSGVSYCTWPMGLSS